MTSSPPCRGWTSSSTRGRRSPTSTSRRAGWTASCSTTSSPTATASCDRRCAMRARWGRASTPSAWGPASRRSCAPSTTRSATCSATASCAPSSSAGSSGTHGRSGSRAPPRRRPRRRGSLTPAQLELFLRATGVTVVISVLSMALAVVGGLALSLMRRHGGRLLRLAAGGYVELFRGTPVLLQLYVLYYGLAPLIALGAFTAAVVGLGLNYAAYEAGLYRAGLDAVPLGTPGAGVL